MDIVFHAQHASVSRYMRGRAESVLRRVARRSGRALDAVARFVDDGRTRTVELELHTSAGRRYVARAEASHFGTALAEAGHRLAHQVQRTRRTPRSRARRARRARARSA